MKDEKAIRDAWQEIYDLCATSRGYEEGKSEHPVMTIFHALEELFELRKPPRWLKLSENPLLPEYVGQKAWVLIDPPYYRDHLSKVEIHSIRDDGTKGLRFSYDLPDRITHYCLLGYPPKFEGEKV